MLNENENISCHDVLRTQLRILRAEKRFSCHELCVLSGISERTYYRFESGISDYMLLRDFVTLSNFYGVTLDWLCGRQISRTHVFASVGSRC